MNNTSIVKIQRNKLCEHLLTHGEGIMGKLVDRLIRFHYLHVSPILVCGESGSGKEFVAKAIQSDGRQINPEQFYAINCAATSREFVTSMLFGHEKGSFTGADKRRIGVIQSAERGVFLDEIDKADISIQAALLRYLRTGEIEAIGKDRPEVHKTQITFGTSTSPDMLLAEMELKLMSDHLNELGGGKDLSRFRKELKAKIDYHSKALEDDKSKWLRDFLNRITPFSLYVPPLRHRKEDLSLMIPRFLQDAQDEFNRKITKVSADLLHFAFVYGWPGNIAELENFIRAGVAFTDSQTLTLKSCLECYTGSYSDKELLFGVSEGSFKKMPWPDYSIDYLRIPRSSYYCSLFHYETEDSFGWPFFMGKRDRSIPVIRVVKLKKILQNLHIMRRLDQRGDYKLLFENSPINRIDHIKLQQFFKLRNKKLSLTEIGKKLGFGTRPTFLKWRKANFVDGQ